MWTDSPPIFLNDLWHVENYDLHMFVSRSFLRVTNRKPITKKTTKTTCCLNSTLLNHSGLINSFDQMIQQVRQTDEISWWTNGKTEECWSTCTTAWRNKAWTYVYIYIYIQLYTYMFPRVLYCFVLMLIQCWLFPCVFSFFVQKRFLLLTNSHSTRFTQTNFELHSKYV